MSENKSQQDQGNDDCFNFDLIRKYPKSNKKVTIQVAPYSIKIHSTNEMVKEENRSTTSFVSPYGLEFQTANSYQDGTLLKIEISIPHYWRRKKDLVSYSRIDAPESFALIARVVASQEVGKRGKKKSVVVQTVNIDEIDEQVLKTFLHEG